MKSFTQKIVLFLLCLLEKQNALQYEITFRSPDFKRASSILFNKRYDYQTGHHTQEEALRSQD